MADTSTCQACGLQSSHPVASQFDFARRAYTIKRCTDCASLFYDPLPVIDYTTHTEDPVYIRDYVEANANIHNLVMLGLGVSGDRRNGRLLDMGCGYGFAADAVRRLRGWEVIGVEPSTYGRVGGEALGIRVLSEFIDPDHWLTRERFDAIVSSEVVEHIDGPTNFLRMLRGMLAEGGVLAITVPEAESALTAENEGSRNALLSPGAHITLFSQNGLEIALRNAGFAHIKVEKRQFSLVGRASDAPLTLPPPADMMEEYIAYLRLLLDDSAHNVSLRHGVASRLFRALANLGRFDEAEAVEPFTPPTIVDVRHKATSYADFIERVGPSVPIDLFYHGMAELNHRANPALAAELFATSFDLCLKKMNALPGGAVVEIEMIWVVLFHQAYAKMIAGKAAEARHILARFYDPLPKGMPAPRDDILVRVTDLIARLDIMAEKHVFTIDHVSKFFNYLHVWGWFHHSGDALVEVVLHDPAVISSVSKVGLPHAGVDGSLGPNRGFRIDALRSSEEIGPEVDIEFRTASGWAGRQSLFSLCGSRRAANTTAHMSRRFHEIVLTMSSPKLLDIGGRRRSKLDRSQEWPGIDCKVLDIMTGDNVDIVADAHEMSHDIEANSIDAVYSVSVFEHLLMPWKVVVEMNRVMKLGGYAFIHTHQTMGLHDTPCDFWRFSQDAWEALFNKSTGFEIIDRGMDDEQFLVPMVYHEGKLGFENSAGFEGSAVLVRKVGDAAVEWPVRVGDVTKTIYPTNPDRASSES